MACAPPNPEYFQCFNLFDEDSVTVRQATRMCEPAQKNGVGNLGLLFRQCFNITDGLDPSLPMPTEVTLATENLGEHRAQVRYATQFCETALKDATPDLVGGSDFYECFSLTARGIDPNREVLVRTRNFGEDTIKVRQATMMCESASKTRGLLPR